MKAPPTGGAFFKLTRADPISSVSAPFRCFPPFFDLPGTKPACIKRKPEIPRKIITDRCCTVLPGIMLRQGDSTFIADAWRAFYVKTDRGSTPVSLI